MSKLSEIQAAWKDFEDALAKADTPWAAALLNAIPLDPAGEAFHRVRDLISGIVAYRSGDGWWGQLTLNGEPVRFVTGVLMEEGRAVGVRRIATNEQGGKLFTHRGPVLEDIYGDIGGWLTQGGGWRETSEPPARRVTFPLPHAQAR